MFLVFYSIYILQKIENSEHSPITRADVRTKGHLKEMVNQAIKLLTKIGNTFYLNIKGFGMLLILGFLQFPKTKLGKI